MRAHKPSRRDRPGIGAAAQAGPGQALLDYAFGRATEALHPQAGVPAPVARIALMVGYASPSRFAVRFRQRFGFTPTAVRGLQS
ncbi:helix-turn-helix domain-containing protein [Duganella sp. FT80W]|uniref:Helix-turn-helix domain-containing protein n=1 Tax=Duganella guangzhouensis TaxID=2666084 RepID=A0A6I2L2T8_9BURK|nr:helix-turn-helix domain-containing protein [Duganella guangzhouensis]MRW90896.1 helix-turn-helix domain-containing protein [Duganella guangzhouensis]